jgi:shikimate kinase
VQEDYSENAQISSNIFLVGLMGAGKTTIGRALARALDKSFFDSDSEIENRTGARISLIFEYEGEAGFRKRETRMIGELTRRTGMVLATGGGAVLCAQNWQRLRWRGTVIYLHAQPQELWQRTCKDKNRPLLQDTNAYTKLCELYAARDALYRACAHLVIETGALSVKRMVDEVQEKWMAYAENAELTKRSTEQTFGSLDTLNSYI